MGGCCAQTTNNKTNKPPKSLAPPPEKMTINQNTPITSNTTTPMTRSPQKQASDEELRLDKIISYGDRQDGFIEQRSSLFFGSEIISGAQQEQLDPVKVLRYELVQQFASDLKNVKVHKKESDFAEKLKKIGTAQKNALASTFQNDLQLPSDTQSRIRTKTQNLMQKVNELNSQYHVVMKADSSVAQINDLERLTLIEGMRALDRSCGATKLLYLPSQNLKVNLYSSVFVNSDTKVTSLCKVTIGKQERKGSSEKFKVEMVAKDVDQSIVSNLMNFGLIWAKVVKKNDAAFPTFNELMNCLEIWLFDQLQTQLQSTNTPKPLSQVILNRYKLTFANLIKASGIQKLDQPLSYLYSDDELCITNPYSRVTCFLLYLYSLELGSPPLYAELNRAANESDMAQLRNLAPFARVMGELLQNGGERRKIQMDKPQTGMHSIQLGQKGQRHNIDGAFILYGVAQLPKERISDYEKLVYWSSKETFCLRGNPTHCTENLQIALQSCLCQVQPHKKFNNQLKEQLDPVLFVIGCQNYRSPNGIRLYSEAYTAYPEEREFLLAGGKAANVYVLGVEKNVILDKKAGIFADCSGQPFSIVHLFLASW